MVRNQIHITFITSLVSIVFFLSSGSIVFAASDNAKSDAFYAKKLETLNEAFEMHIRQLDKCISEMDMFEKKDTGLLFNEVECSELKNMRADAQALYSEARVVLEDYLRWINSLAENTSNETVKQSHSSQSKLSASMQTYLARQKEALIQSERIMQMQVRRLSEMEQMLKEAEQQIDSN